VLTGGERHDAKAFDRVWSELGDGPGPGTAVMDKAYDSDAIRGTLAERGVEAVIPARANRAEGIPQDGEKYKLRDKVERFFNQIKHFRRIATRYDKLGKTFLAFVHVVASWITLRQLVNTA